MTNENYRKLSQCSHIFGKPRDNGTRRCLICMYIDCTQCEVEFIEGELLGHCKNCGRIHLRLRDYIETKRAFEKIDNLASNKLKRG